MSRRRNAVLGLASIVFITLMLLIVWVWLWADDWLIVRKETNATEVQQPTSQSIESRLLVMGDVFWGRYINDWSMRSELKYAYPFSRLQEFERDKYDAWIADLECPVTNNPKVSSVVEDSTLQFDCSPEYLPEAKKWFTAFTLANNHTDNQGLEGVLETRQHLKDNDIQYFGDPNPENHADLCDVLSLPTRITMSDGAEKLGELPLVWCGHHGVFRTPSDESIAVVGEYAEKFNVIAMPHSGAEYKPAPDEIKTTFYRKLIDNGADVVLGDHPHWIQTSEAYKGKMIVYSMGNFIFDQQFSNEVTRSAVVDMTVSVNAKDITDLDKWLALGKECREYADNCLQKAEEQNLTKLPLKFRFSILGSDNSGKLVHRADEGQLMSIKQRLNWTETIKGLNGLHSGQ